MTKSCGDSVTETHLTFQLEEGGLTPTSPLQFTFEVISAKAACDLNLKWHSRFPQIHWSNVVRNKQQITIKRSNKSTIYMKNKYVQ